MSYTKILKLCSSKNIFKEMKTLQWKKIFSFHITHKGIVSRIDKVYTRVRHDLGTKQQVSSKRKRQINQQNIRHEA